MEHTERRWPHLGSALFLTGLCLAVGFSIMLDGGLRLAIGTGRASVEQAGPGILEVAQPSALTESDRRAAEIAWAYFEQNTAPTGLVRSVAGYPATTLWDQGSYLLGLISAHRLGVVQDEEFHVRAERLIAALSALSLYDGTLPNKAYNTETLALTNYQDEADAQGIGWSAIDIARMLAGLRALERAVPHLGADVRGLIAGWSLDAMVADGELVGALREGGASRIRQEGRIGYEQYAARAAALWGLDTLAAVSADRVLDWTEIGGNKVPADLRRKSAYGAIVPVLSEPYMLMGLELGLDSESRVLASLVFEAQRGRYERDGVLTMVSEDHLDQAPHFAYATVHSDGDPWAVLTDDGRNVPEFRTVSTKAAFAWYALYRTDYAKRARDAVLPLGDPLEGWQAGIYEADGAANAILTLNTNAVILEALHFQAFGPVLKAIR